MPNSEYTCRINTDLHLHKSRPFLAQFHIASKSYIGFTGFQKFEEKSYNFSIKSISICERKLESSCYISLANNSSDMTSNIYENQLS